MALTIYQNVRVTGAFNHTCVFLHEDLHKAFCSTRLDRPMAFYSKARVMFVNTVYIISYMTCALEQSTGGRAR